jgi:hypothetical protein
MTVCAFLRVRVRVKLGKRFFGGPCRGPGDANVERFLPWEKDKERVFEGVDVADGIYLRLYRNRRGRV